MVEPDYQQGMEGMVVLRYGETGTYNMFIAIYPLKVKDPEVTMERNMTFALYTFIIMQK